MENVNGIVFWLSSQNQRKSCENKREWKYKQAGPGVERPFLREPIYFWLRTNLEYHLNSKNAGEDVIEVSEDVITLALLLYRIFSC